MAVQQTFQCFEEWEVEPISTQEQFEQMVHDYERLVFSVCVKLTGDYFVSEDLTQETCLSAFRHLREFDGVSPKAWLCRIASNKCIDYNRQLVRRGVFAGEEALQEQEGPNGKPEECYLEQEMKEQLVCRCRRLKPPYDEIARLYFCEEYKAEEIAQLKGKNVKTIRTQVYRARAMLRKLYEKERD